MGILEAQDALRKVAAALWNDLPPGADRIRLEFEGLGGYSWCIASVEPAATAPGGKVAPSLPTRQAASALRSIMHRPDAGTWFRATIEVSRAGSLDADFDYDGEPEWAAEAVDKHFADEQRLHPRAVENQPAWLRARLERLPGTDPVQS